MPKLPQWGPLLLKLGTDAPNKTLTKDLLSFYMKTTIFAVFSENLPPFLIVSTLNNCVFQLYFPLQLEKQS